MQAALNLVFLNLSVVSLLYLLRFATNLIGLDQRRLAFGFPVFFLSVCLIGYYAPPLVYRILLLLLIIFFVLDLFKNSSRSLNWCPNIVWLAFMVTVISSAIIVAQKGIVFFSEGIGDLTIFAPTPYALNGPMFTSLNDFRSALFNLSPSLNLENLSPNERLIELGWTIENPGWFSLMLFLKQFALPVEWAWFISNTFLITVMLVAVFEGIDDVNTSLNLNRINKMGIKAISTLPCFFYGSYIAFFNGSFAQLQGQAICACYMAAIAYAKFNLSISWHLIFILAGLIAYYPSAYVLLCILLTSTLLQLRIKSSK